MEIRVYWTETALNNLENIFEYYKHKASIRIAKKLVKELVKSTIKIQKTPQIGKKEELLADRKFVNSPSRLYFNNQNTLILNFKK